MATTDRNSPLAPHMRPCAQCWCIWWMGNKPPSKRVYVLGVLRVCMALKILLCCGNNSLPEQRSNSRAIHTLNPPQNYIQLLWGLWPIHLMYQCGAQGLMWGARVPFLPSAAMVVVVVMPVVCCCSVAGARGSGTEFVKFSNGSNTNFEYSNLLN